MDILHILKGKNLSEVRMKDTYKEVRVFQYDNAVVRVHIPDLTPDEQNRRMKEVEKAAVQVLLSKKERK
jgi:hypothetical protein